MQSTAVGLDEKAGIMRRRVAQLTAEHTPLLAIGVDRRLNSEWASLLTPDTDHLNLSLDLSQQLLDTPLRQVPLIASEVVSRLLAGNGPLLVDHIELLFEPILQVDPLRVLKLAARQRSLLVVWPGTIENGQLVYAQPGHPEYWRYDPADLVDVVVVDASTLRWEE